MCKSLYQMKNDISDKIMANPNTPSDTDEDSIKKYTERVLIPMATLFDVKIKNENSNNYNIPNKLATLIETEVVYRKQEPTPKAKPLTTFIDYIINQQWDKIKADDLRSFFLPIFNSDYIKRDEEYFQDLKKKLDFCLDYYSVLNPKSIPSYIQKDIKSFIDRVYDQKELPTRNYEKLLEIINNGEV